MSSEALTPHVDRVRERALDQLPDASVVVFDLDSRLILARGALLSRLGLTSEALEGSPTSDVLGSRTWSGRWAGYAPLCARVLDGQRVELDVTSSDGSSSFHLVAGPVFDDDGVVVGGVAWASDDTEIRRVHEQLVASEERFRLLAENSSDFVMRTTPEGVVEWISAGVTDLLGWEPDEMVGLHSLDFAHPDVRAGILSDTTRVNVGDTISGRTRVRCKDGSYRWVARTLRPVFGEGGDVVARVSGWHDAEAEVAAETALQSSEEMFRLAFDTASVGIFICGIDQRFQRVNPAMASMLGYEIAELTGMTFHDLTHPDELEGSSDAVVRMVTGETTRLKLRKRYLRKDGTVVWGDVSMAVARDPDGSPRLVLGQLIDVSAEVANFEAMQRAASDLRLLAENASDVVLRINEHGTIVWVSPSVRTVLGWEPDVLVGTPSLSIVVHEDHEKVNAGRDIWRAGGDTESSVIGYRTSWGETREMAGRVRPMRDPDGTYRGGIVGLRDVTEEQQMRRELAYRASHDALTGVYNRDDLMQRLSDKLALPVRPRRPLGVLFIDVDNLKLVNDNLGHDVGDRVLVSIALALGAAVRREDVVARLSGDEFVVLVDHVDDAASLRLIAEKVRTTVGALPAIDGVTVSVSIGAVVAARDEDPSEVLKRADRALYAAKHGGRNQVCIDAGQHGQ